MSCRSNNADGFAKKPNEKEIFNQQENNMKKFIQIIKGFFAKPNVMRSKINHFYPVYLQSDNYKKLLVIQTIPEEKYWFKDEEMTIEKLTLILETA